MEQFNEKAMSAENVEKRRAGFITFWLWLGIIVNVIQAPFAVMQIQGFRNLGYLGIQLVTAGVDIAPFSQAVGAPVNILTVATLISVACCIFGYALLLKWKMKGYYFFVFVAVLNLISSLWAYPMIEEAYWAINLSVDLSFTKYLMLISSCLSLFFLWLILQIKKDGKSCWSQLE